MAHAKDMPVVVCSYQSSGTNLLLASIWKNFKLPDTSRRVYVKTPSKRVFLVEGQPQQYVDGNYVVSPWAAMFGTHRPIERLPFVYSLRGVSRDKVLYIVRNPVDTLVSLWKRKDPEDKAGWRERINEETILAWYNHACGYVGKCGGWVAYETLVRCPDLVLRAVERLFSLERKSESFQPVLGRVGWVKQPEPVDREDPGEEMLSLFREIIPYGFLGYEL